MKLVAPSTLQPDEGETWITQIDPFILGPSIKVNKHTNEHEVREFPKVWKLCTRKRIRIPPSREATVWLTLPPAMVQGFEADVAVLEPINKKYEPLMVATQLVTVARRIPVKVLNAQETKVTLNKNSLLGYLTVLPQTSILGAIAETTSNSITVERLWCRSLAKVSNPRGEEIADDVEQLYNKHAWLRELDISSKLNDFQKLQLLSLISRYEKAFSTSQYDLGLTTELEFEIPTNNQTPIAVPPYRLPYQKKQILRDILPGQLEAGIIEPSTSAYNNPIVSVKKKQANTDYASI